MKIALKDAPKIAAVLLALGICIFHMEAQAVLEHTTGWAYHNGYCRVRNVKALNGTGELYGGVYKDNREILGHVRGFKDGKQVELTWPESEPVIVDAVIKVHDYKIVSAKITSDEAARNLRYVRAALKTDYFLSKI